MTTLSTAEAGRRVLLVFATAAFLAVAAGAWGMSQSDLPPSLWLRNLLAWFIAGMTGLGMVRWGRFSLWGKPASLVIIPISLVLLMACFASAGQAGVHRWLGIGPIQFNAAALILPVVIATTRRDSHLIAFIGLALLSILLAIQPDASQLGAFGVAFVVLCVSKFGVKGWAAALWCLAAAIICLSRADPLQAVGHVEGIASMVWAHQPAIAVLMVAAIVMAALSPLALWPVREARTSAVALSLYGLVSLLACLSGKFPVPLAGYGLSYVIGWWWGVAALVASAKRTDGAAPSGC
ncbi:hypothetical protein MMA231_01142 [Asticcacaulis sp. MM231]|uniref:hypothetical protein n=1 Tax=Asticcacaulis sp. MM231 TaxID=3157666 RepID=UPI0032D57D6A